MGIEGVIFDLDDVLIDSHGAHMALLEGAIREFESDFLLYGGIQTLNPEEEKKLLGLKVSEQIALLVNKFSLQTSGDSIHAAYREFLRDKISDLVVPAEGLHDVLGDFKRLGYKLAVASSSPRTKIEFVVAQLGLSKYFGDNLVAGEGELVGGKPDPDIFLKAAHRIALPADKIVVVEDSLLGVYAAKAAGMYCVGFHNPAVNHRLGSRSNLRGAGADLEIYSLRDLTPRFIKGLTER
jgi:HAD superfamily hydrolase (TIGR01509 family)